MSFVFFFFVQNLIKQSHASQLQPKESESIFTLKTVHPKPEQFKTFYWPVH